MAESTNPPKRPVERLKRRLLEHRIEDVPGPEAIHGPGDGIIIRVDLEESDVAKLNSENEAVVRRNKRIVEDTGAVRNEYLKNWCEPFREAESTECRRLHNDPPAEGSVREGLFEAHLPGITIAQEGAEYQPGRFSVSEMVP